MAVTIRFEDLRARNRAAVVAAIRKAGQMSRTELVRRTGLSHSTISAIAADLLGEGVLREGRAADLAPARRGRPQVALELNPKAGAVVTAVLSLNQIAVSLVDFAGQAQASRFLKLPTAILGSSSLVDAIGTEIAALLAAPEAQAAPVQRLALGVQGVTDAGRRLMRWSPITPHRDIPFAAALEARFDMPATVENDCSMIALALRQRAPDRHGDDFVAVLLSHGIGMGLMLRGEVFAGTASSAAELGHMIHKPNGAQCRCGRRGCIEAYAGHYAIWRRARGLGRDLVPDDVDDDAVAALAQEARADPHGPAAEAFREAAAAIGLGLGSLFALIDPAPVTFVGAGAASLDLLEPALRENLAATAGGQDADAYDFAVEPDEMPLIREGCALRALTLVDAEVVAPGTATPLRRDVA